MLGRESARESILLGHKMNSRADNLDKVTRGDLRNGLSSILARPISCRKSVSTEDRSKGEAFVSLTSDVEIRKKRDYNNLDPNLHKRPDDRSCKVDSQLESQRQMRALRTTTRPAGMNFFDLMNRFPITTNNKAATPEHSQALISSNRLE